MHKLIKISTENYNCTLPRNIYLIPMLDISFPPWNFRTKPLFFRLSIYSSSARCLLFIGYSLEVSPLPSLLAPCLRFSSNPPPPTAIFPPPPLPPICRISPFAPGLLPSHPALHLHLQPNKPFSVPSLIGKKNSHSLHCKCCTLPCVGL